MRERGRERERERGGGRQRERERERERETDRQTDREKAGMCLDYRTEVDKIASSSVHQAGSRSLIR